MAVQEFTVPIADISTFDALIASVLDKRVPTVAAFGSVATELMANAAFEAAMGDAVPDAESDTYSC